MMDREEAIATLEDIKQFGISKWIFETEDIEAFDMAIEALKAKTDGDLISREEVLKMIIVAGECEPDLGYTHLHTVIESLPSADRPSGEWTRETIIGLGVEHYNGYRCSECGSHCYPKSNYCPNCGAKMGGSK